MEIASIWFFSVSYLFSTICCRVGNDFLFYSVNSNYDHPLSTRVVNAVIYTMSLLVFTSSAYAFLLRPVLENRQFHTPLHFGFPRVVKVLVSVILGQLFLVAAPLYLLSGPEPIAYYFDEIIRPSVFLIECLYFILTFLLYFFLYYIFAYRIPISPSIRMYFDHAYVWGFCSVILNDLAVPIVSLYLDGLVHLLYLLVPLSLWISCIAFKERFGMWSASPSLIWIYRRRKLIEFAIGMVGSILFQYFFRWTSTAQMEAFLFFAAAWLGNLAMVQPTTDLGIFNFLLVNACLSWAVNLFKLRTPYTWLVFGVCFLLYFLRWKLDSVTLRYDGIFESTHSQSLPQTLSTHSQSPPPVLPQTLPSSPPSAAHDWPTPPTISSSATISHLHTFTRSTSDSINSENPTSTSCEHQNLQIDRQIDKDGNISINETRPRLPLSPPSPSSRECPSRPTSASSKKLHINGLVDEDRIITSEKVGSTVPNVQT